MVTGDNLRTARAIALECGILGSNADAIEPNLIEGKTFRALSEAQRLEVADKISVMGRSSPYDKLLLVQALRKIGHVVAVTGDGTNDSPALYEADIGLAMGIQGTQVAKESSDIIILDDNFSSVVKVVRWGRSVYANIQKFIQFQLTVIVAALVINGVAAVSSGDVPLTAVQLLWVYLIMDTLGALALATEPPTDHLMNRLPVGRREPLITNVMWRNLLVQKSTIHGSRGLYCGSSGHNCHVSWEVNLNCKAELAIVADFFCYRVHQVHPIEETRTMLKQKRLSKG
ncbi:hypothetical protein M8C21_002522 [Ambrosia artemisiifolia]|uniref:Cation-transporting P-type ATPase C-terminal domain-containing protein n=1 Tax=Ambrosia artemisiifolia TaxID=4212 RepID=A0AAD5GNU9_AMBAR|nr:hypothetical protein M8C21_002522 [Ambrosia artemisiifolia]